jgi:hypothetical protein
MDPVEITQPQDSRNREVAGLSWWAQRQSTILLLAALLWTTLVVTHGITKGEFCYINDEGLHAVTGLYFADFLHDLPLTHPIEYTLRYEAQYPALGLLRWPPFFHFVEGVMFLLLGRSVVVARLAILMFALFGFYFWFKLVTELQDPWTAAVSTVVLVSHRSILLFEKVVMLEIPGMALCIAASYFWIRFLKKGESRHIVWFALLATASVFTIYHSVYLPAFCLLTITVERKWRRLLNPIVLLAAAIILLLVVPYSIVALRHHGRKLMWLAFQNQPVQSTGLNAYTYYWRKLPAQLGWPLLVLSFAGLLTSKWWAKRDCARVMLSWIAACYLTMSFLSTKEPRYMVYWLPAFVCFAVGPLTAKPAGEWLPGLRACAVLGVSVTCFWSAWTYQRPFVSGYETAARRVIEHEGSGFVLFDGDLPGNFIFFMRSLDPARRFFVLRKALYLFDKSTPVITTRAELKDLIDRYGIKSIVISENVEIRFDVQRYLRELLQTPEVRLVERFPVKGSAQWYREAGAEMPQSDDLLFYEKLHVAPRSAHVLTLRMPTLDHDITIPLDDSVPP